MASAVAFVSQPDIVGSCSVRVCVTCACVWFRLSRVKANEADQAVANVMGEVHKLEAKRSSNRNVMAQTSKDLSHVKKAAVTTEQQLHDKEELLEQASVAFLSFSFFNRNSSTNPPLNVLKRKSRMN